MERNVSLNYFIKSCSDLMLSIISTVWEILNLKNVRVLINAKFEHNSFDITNDVTELSKIIHSLRKI